MWIPNLGFVNGLGPNTDFALGLAGGGFADSYNEIHDGTYYPSESFEGNGAEISASVYHRFNPAERDSAELHSARHGALCRLQPQQRHRAGFSTAEQSRRFQRAHRPALGRRGADAVSAAGDGIVRLV